MEVVGYHEGIIWQWWMSCHYKTAQSLAARFANVSTVWEIWVSRGAQERFCVHPATDLNRAITSVGGSEVEPFTYLCPLLVLASSCISDHDIWSSVHDRVELLRNAWLTSVYLVFGCVFRHGGFSETFVITMFFLCSRTQKALYCFIMLFMCIYIYMYIIQYIYIYNYPPEKNT